MIPGVSANVAVVDWLSAIGITLTTLLLLVSIANIAGSVGSRRWLVILAILLLVLQYIELAVITIYQTGTMTS